MKIKNDRKEATESRDHCVTKCAAVGQSYEGKIGS